MKTWTLKFLFLILLFAVGPQGSIPWKTLSARLENKIFNASRNKNKLHMKKEEPILNFSIYKEGKQIRIKYKVTNNSLRDIFIFNVMWDIDYDGKEHLAKNRVYVSLLNNTLLCFSKRIPPIPHTKTVEWAYVPYASRIKPGKTFEEEIILSMPIEEYNPYFPKENLSKTVIKIAKSCMLSIDYMYDKEDLQIKETQIKDAFSVWHPDMKNLIKTLRSDRILIPIEVSYRQDEFERF